MPQTGNIWESLGIEIPPNLTQEGEDLCEPGRKGAAKLLQDSLPAGKGAGSKGTQKTRGIKTN